jgi:hypothetical protein
MKVKNTLVIWSPKKNAVIFSKSNCITHCQYNFLLKTNIILSNASLEKSYITDAFLLAIKKS